MRRPEVAARMRDWALDNMKIWKERPMELRLTPPAAERLGELQGPALLLVGEEDIPDIHGVIDALQEAIPGVQRVELEGAGHMINLERPEAFNRVVLQFLDGWSGT